MTAKNWTWAKVEKASTPVETSATVCVRGDLALEHERLEAELQRAQQEDLRENRAPVAPQIAQQIVDLEAELAEYQVEFRFRGLGRKAFTDLIAAHPVTPEQQEQAGDVDLPWNVETFPPALVALTCVEPKGVTEDAAYRASVTWTLGQWAKLWRACIHASQGSADPGPKSLRASVVLQGSAQN